MEKNRKNQVGFILILILALGLRMILACVCKGFLTDVGCFYAWALRAYEEGLFNFYASGGFSDYPPGYMAVLYVVGALIKFFNAPYLSAVCMLLVKTPAILCDLAAGILIYRIAGKKFQGIMPLVLAGIYLFNPAVLYNSVVWGQVDSVFTIAVILVCVLMQEKKTIPAYFVFVTGILLKPQTLVFAPLVLLGIYENVFAHEFTWKKFWTNLCGGCLSLACMFLFCVPFGFRTIMDTYTNTLGSYPYVSVNAYNFWSMFGKNWASQEERIWNLISYKTMGTVVIVLICIFSAVIFIKRKEREDRYFVTGAFIIATMFTFSVRMHERYLFPVMILLLLTYLTDRRKGFLVDYIVLSLFHLLNVWHVLTYYDPSSYNGKAMSIILISLGTVLGVCSLYRHIFLLKKEEVTVRKSQQISDETENVSSGLSGYFSAWFGPLKPEADRKNLPITRSDVFIMIAVSCFYAVFTFVNLGDHEVPQNGYVIQMGENVMLNLPEGEEVTTLAWYTGNELEPEFSLWEWDNTKGEWNSVQNVKLGNVYSWGSMELDRPIHGSICFLAIEQEHTVKEFVFLNANGEQVIPTNAAEYPALFDESNLYPDETGFMNSCYFDEIYYTRTAYEMKHGLKTYEWTHPPFGKIMMMIGMTLFGETPFGFRFMGALYGVMMLPFLYLLARNITRSRMAGAFASFIFAFDFMHFTQTRITTIDVFITFFVILMYYFMEQYTRTDFMTDDLKETLIPLGACGIAFGFGVSSKWTGMYAGAGLALIFFLTLYRRFRESRYLYQNEKKEEAVDFWHSPEWKRFRFCTYKTLLFCVVFFIVIPLCIYVLCYIPFRTDNPEQGLISRMITNQSSMLSYHSGLESTHPYSSMWYEWPTMIKPMLYYSKDLGNGMVRGISAFGNPLVWWMGLPAFVYTLYLVLRKQDKTAAFLCIGYLAEYLPWFFVSRVVFIYHYFPSVPFLVLMITYGLNRLMSGKKRKTSESGIRKYRKAIVFGVYAAAVFGLFLMFYPVLSGAPVKRDFVVNMLRWLDGWVLAI